MKFLRSSLYLLTYLMTTLLFWVGIMVLQDKCAGTSSLAIFQTFFCHYRSNYGYWWATFLVDTVLIIFLVVLKPKVKNVLVQKIITYRIPIYLIFARLGWFILIQILPRSDMA